MLAQKIAHLRVVKTNPVRARSPTGVHSGAVLPEEWHPQQQVMLPNSKMKLTQSILGVFSICFAQNEQGLALRAPTRIDKPRKTIL